jgi:hypothetical protein
MRPFYNTPSLINLNPTPEKPKLTGLELVHSIEDEYSSYMDACEKGYCKLDKNIVAELKSDLEKAKMNLIIA